MPYSIPIIPPGHSKLRHALTYARLGWYLLPVARGQKHPGSLLGKDWPEQSSCSAAQVRDWWRQWPHAEIALHCGRSDMIVVDVDHPGAVPELLAAALPGAPLALTRKQKEGGGERGHYFFRQPPGRRLGNSPGSLGRGWGEIRGDNGVVILAGSEHFHEVFPEKAEAERLAAHKAGIEWTPGHYSWARTGVVPVLPDSVAAALGEAVEHARAVTPAVVNAWLEAHSPEDALGGQGGRQSRWWAPRAGNGVLKWYSRQVEHEAGLSRHDLGRDAVCMVLRESAVGAYPAAPVLVELRKLWENSLKTGPRGERAPGAGEWDSFVIWSVSQMAAFERDEDAQWDIRKRVQSVHGISSQYALGLSPAEFHELWEKGYYGPEQTAARRLAAGRQAVADAKALTRAGLGGAAAASAVAGVEDGPEEDGEEEDPLEGEEEEYELARRKHILKEPSDDTRWLLQEMGQGGLSGLFRRGPHVIYTPHVDELGYLAGPGGDEETGPYQVQRMTGSILRSRVSVLYDVTKYKQIGSGQKSMVIETRPLFPLDCAIAALEAQEGEAINLRDLRGTTHTPMVRADGTLLDEPGYDDDTGFLYLPTGGMEDVKVPARPTRRQVVLATALLRGMIKEFPWVSQHDEANYLGLLLTPLLRLVAPPPYKLGVFNATNPGTGKSLLVDVMGQVHGIEKFNEMPGDSAELDKVLAGVLSTTTNPVVCFDNVTGVLRSSKMAALLTSSAYSARILGTTNSTGLVNDRLWTVTGNSVALGGDMPRRAVWISLDTGAPNPEERRGFSVNLVGGWAREHRVELFSALLTWVRAWAAAGMPVDKVGEDSYGTWIGIVRGILSVVGVPGEFDCMVSKKITVSDDDTEWAEFLGAVMARFGHDDWTTADLFAHVEGAPMGPEEVVGALPNSLHEKYVKAGTAGSHVAARSLGKWLQNRAGRWADGMAIEDAGMDRTKKKRWRVKKMG